ncbi:hypothetical protein [Gilliamella sp. B2838]|uniref:hypothetical protein n=1 Tax=Gilliamella sp. B2838 TaxID=2818020 RepID=UPI00226A5716|nr:hypothetical protein [Gilliamella sp. B2838]MCX8726408.1 hypothetical protein [Gilliamella sp. B2838]
MTNVVKRKVVFYFPWREVSGGPYYLTRLADKLAENSSFEVYYTDYEKGLSDKLLKNPLVKKIEVGEHDFGIHMDNEPVLLITPIYWACWLPSMHPDSKILFFNWHNSCISVLKKVWDINNKLITDFLRIVKSTNSVFFADYSHRMAQNTKNIIFDECYVPVVMKRKSKFASSKLVKIGEINIAVLGRLCLDKIYSIIDLLNHFNRLDFFSKKHIYIIGSGEDKEKIHPNDFPNLIIHFMGTVTSNKLDEFLSTKVDVLFAMGTSILEGAAIKLPSVIIPHNVVPFTCNKYVYLQDTIKYCLGWFDTQIEELNLNTRSLKEIIEDIYIRNQKKKLGEDAYKYFIKNHTIESVIGNLTDAMKRTSFTYRDFKIFNNKINNMYRKCKRWKVMGVSIVTLFKNRDNDIRINIFNIIPLLYYKQSKERKTKILYFWKIPLLTFTNKKNGSVVKVNVTFILKIIKWIKGR